MPVQIIHGEEEFKRSETISRLRASFVQPGLGDLNCTSLDGRKLTIPVLREACETMPFLAGQRLVIVSGLLERCDPSSKNDTDEPETKAPRTDPALCMELIAYLSLIPPFTHLALCETKQLAARNPVLKYAQGNKSIAVERCDMLDSNTLPAWLIRQVEVKQQSLLESSSLTNADPPRLTIDGDAARALVNQVGNNLRQLDTEIDKLAAFANYGTITIEHVRQLATENLEARIFAMVDALGRCERKTALHELELLLETGAHPLYILTMVVRQYRLLIMAKELIEEQQARAQYVAAELKVRDFIAQKLLQQAALYSSAELAEIYQALIAIDQGIKTGRVEGELALELFLFDVTRSAQKASRFSRTMRAN